jgi:Ca-activated chloride channel family protein
MELFREPKYLIFMILADVMLIALAYLSYRKKNKMMSAVIESKLLVKLIPRETVFLKKLKTSLFILGFSFIFLAWALPQWGVKFASVQMRTGQLIIAADCSLSMLAKDLAPSRMENAKMMLKVLVTRLKDYRSGIVAFSSKSYVQCPVTTDTDALKYFISRISAGMLPVQGTSLSGPIELAGETLSKYPGQKALVILTDGEDHNKPKLESALKKAKDSGIVIFTIGIGSPQGGLIPEGNSTYKLDKNKNPIVTRLDENTLIKLAAETGGAYIRYSDAQSVADELASQLKNLTKIKYEGKAGKIYKNRYQIPLLVAVLLLLLELVIPERKIFRRRKNEN